MNLPYRGEKTPYQYDKNNYSRNDRNRRFYEPEQWSKSPSNRFRSNSRHEKAGSEYPPGTARCVAKRPFDEAGLKLAQILEVSLAYFGHFLSAFDEEIKAVRRYAGSEILNELWVARIKWSVRSDHLRGNPTSKSEHSVEDAFDEGNVETPQNAKGFLDLSKALLRCLSQAADSDARPRSDRPKCPDDIDNATRAVKKLRVAYQDFEQVLQDAKRHYGRVPALVKEMEFILRILDDIGGIRSSADRKASVGSNSCRQSEEEEHEYSTSGGDWVNG